MSRLRLLRWVVQISRFGLAALFLFAAVAKLFTIRDFVANVSHLVWTGWAWPVAVIVIALELSAALLLIWPRTVRLGGALAALLLLGFAGYALYYTRILNGEPLECGCFGGIVASQLGVSTALRNLVLLLPASLVAFAHRRRRRVTNERAEATEPAVGLIEQGRV
jgi:hypothetical protein